MKPLTHSILALCVACITLFGVGCASMYDDGSWTAEDDLQQDIQLRLDQDAMMYKGNVRVTVDQGVATLHGSVPNEHARARAIAITEGVAGVNQVVDVLYRR